MQINILTLTLSTIQPIIQPPLYLYQPSRFKGALARTFRLALSGRRCFVRGDERRPYIGMSGGRHSYSWRWNRESKQAESIGLIKLLSSWKTRWAAVALPLPLLLLLLCRRLFSLPYPDCQASWPPLVVDGRPASSAFARNLVSPVNLVAVERGTRCWRPISPWIVWRLIYTYPVHALHGFICGRHNEVSSPRGESWNFSLGRHLRGQARDDAEFPWFPHVVRHLMVIGKKVVLHSTELGSRFELTLKIKCYALI